MKKLIRAACVIASLAAPAVFAESPKATAPTHEQAVKAAERPTLEVVFVLDTTPPAR
jgi:hypothetical protein